MAGSIRWKAYRNSIRERLRLFILISIIIFPIHEMSHIIAQVAFGVPVVINVYWYGISTNENISSVLAYDPAAFYIIVIAGLLGTLVAMPLLKKPLMGLFPGFEQRNGIMLYYLVFLIAAFSIAAWDLVFLAMSIF